MIRIDGSYLYQLGHELHGVQNIRIFPSDGQATTSRAACLGVLYPAKFALDTLVSNSIYRQRKLNAASDILRQSLAWAIEHCLEEGFAESPPTVDIIFQLQDAHRDFEAVLKAELSNIEIWLVQPKAAFDVSTLIEAGYLAFPPSVVKKVPECCGDLSDAMKCIAFELSTAAAFHLHRANETVLGRYWDSVSAGKRRPKNQTLGSYINALETDGFSDEHVLSALRDVKNLHRNPTIHADQSLTSIEDAIDLYGEIRACISTMLKSINQPDADKNFDASLES